MELEEAKKIILSYIDRYEYVNKSVRYDENGYKATLEKHIEAFNTVIGDLHAMQNLLDEKNDELEHLQKDSINKEKLIEIIDFGINATDSNDNYSIGLCNGMIYIKSIITDGNPNYKKCQNNSISKDKIREKIDNRISTIENLLDEMVDKSIGCINVSYLSKKEKEKIILKRNCLTVQKATLIDIKKDLLKEE